MADIKSSKNMKVILIYWKKVVKDFTENDVLQLKITPQC